MKQIFEPYWKWEDFNHGMYEPPSASALPQLCSKAMGILADHEAFAVACVRVCAEWPVATAVNLTNVSTNRRAWLGQAACSLVHGVPEIATRAAWKELTDEQRVQANRIADEAIREYESKSRGVHQEVGAAWICGWDS